MDRQISTYRKLHVSQSLPSRSKRKLAVLLMLLESFHTEYLHSDQTFDIR